MGVRLKADLRGPRLVGMENTSPRPHLGISRVAPGPAHPLAQWATLGCH